MKTLVFFCVIVSAGIVLGLTQRDDALQYYPRGPASGIVWRTHPLKSDKFVLVEWARDNAYGETGWCTWAASPGERPRFHLVLRADAETWAPTHPAWWKNKP